MDHAKLFYLWLMELIILGSDLEDQSGVSFRGPRVNKRKETGPMYKPLSNLAARMRHATLPQPQMQQRDNLVGTESHVGAVREAWCLGGGGSDARDLSRPAVNVGRRP